MKILFVQFPNDAPIGRTGQRRFGSDRFELSLDEAKGTFTIGDLASGETWQADKAGAFWRPEKEAPRGGDSPIAASDAARPAKKR